MVKQIVICLLFMVTPYTAQAGKKAKNPSLALTVVTTDDAPIPTARFWFPNDSLEASVNAITASASLSARYLDDGTEILFTYGETVDLFVSAPGYETKKHRVVLDKKRRVASTIVLSRLDLLPFTTLEPLPNPIDAHAKMSQAFHRSEYHKATDWAQRTLKDLHAATTEVPSADALYDAKMVLALSALGLWETASQAFAVSLQDEDHEKMKVARGLADTRAREWVEVTRKLERDPNVPLKICNSIAPATLQCD